MPPRSPLYTAFSALYRHAPPAAQDRALRQAIAVLVAPGAAAPRLYTGPVAAPPGRWEGLRPRLREVASEGPGARREVAEALGLAETTLSRMLTPHHTGPGVDVLAKAEAWLATRSTSATAPAGGDHPDSCHPSPPFGNGAAASRSRNKLSRTEREALAGHLELDPAGVRRWAGVTRELAEKAIVGQDLPVEAAARFAAYTGF
jgi:hypothetical protein